MEEKIASEFHDAYTETTPNKLETLWNEYAPKTLIKFFPATYEQDGTNYFLEHLKNKSLWLSSPKKFNDPFDCTFNYNYKEYISQIVPPFFAQIFCLPNICANAQTTQLQNKLNQAYEDFNKEMLRICHKLEDSMFVSCFAEKDNIYSSRMWGHYALNHTGACAEYDWTTVKDASPFGCIPIKYTDQYEYYPIPSNTREGTKNFLKFYTKSKEWSYEKEWRISHQIELNQDGFLISFKSPIKVYLGCKASSKLINDVKQLCLNNNIELYQMITKPNSFCLSYQKID